MCTHFIVREKIHLPAVSQRVATNSVVMMAVAVHVGPVVVHMCAVTVIVCRPLARRSARGRPVVMTAVVAHAALVQRVLAVMLRGSALTVTAPPTVQASSAVVMAAVEHAANALGV